MVLGIILRNTKYFGSFRNGEWPPVQKSESKTCVGALIELDEITRYL